MHRFSFRLQSILRLREYDEREKKLALGEVTGRCAAVRSSIEERELIRSKALVQLTPQERHDVIFRRSLEEFTYRLERECEALTDRWMKCEEERKATAQAYQEAHRKAGVLRKFREKKEEAHRHEERQKEQYVLDEVARTIHRQREVHDGTV